MDKITYILYILKWIEPYWQEATNIIRIIENKLYDDEYINSIVNLLKSIINKVTDDKLRGVLEGTLDKINLIREQEKLENEASLLEAEMELDKLFN